MCVCVCVCPLMFVICIPNNKYEDIYSLTLYTFYQAYSIF